MAKDNPKTNPITIKPKIASHVAGLFSWVPLLYCSPPGHPLTIKSLALPADVSPWTIYFRVSDKSPVSGPGRGPLSCNRTIAAAISIFISYSSTGLHIAQCKDFSCNAGDSGSIPRLGRFFGEGTGHPLQYSCLENSMNRGAWQAIVYEIAKSWTWLSN